MNDILANDTKRIFGGTTTPPVFKLDEANACVYHTCISCLQPTLCRKISHTVYDAEGKINNRIFCGCPDIEITGGKKGFRLYYMCASCFEDDYEVSS